ncbi:MAG: ParA family protein [Microthrixaceae bacterium]
MGQVVTIVNQKGGVGKTSVTMGLASAAMTRGHKTLVVDLDPQGASSWVLGVNADRVTRSVTDLLQTRRPSADKVIVESRWGHLVDVVPSVPELQDLEVMRGGLESLTGTRTETRLRRARAGDGPVRDRPGRLPPSLGALTANGLAAANHALLVVEPTALSLRGIDPVADLIEDVWDHHNKWLDLAGVIVNRAPARSQDAEAHLAELHRIVGRSAVWEPYIRTRVAIAEAAASRRPIHALGTRGAAAATTFDALYRRLWRLVKPARAR